MDSTLLIKPKQKRSQQTQDKLLASLQHLLKHKFFEHISIKELTDHASVSVGTFYRRFKNKESLLPLLYQDFGTGLEAWLKDIEQTPCSSLDEIINKLCTHTFVFFTNHKGVFRTLHLNSRLHSDLLDSDQNNDRRKIYQRMARLLAKQMSVAVNTNNNTNHDQTSNTYSAQTKAEMAVFIMISTLLDKIVYKNLTPAVATRLEGEAFVTELAQVLLIYLSND